MKNDLELWNFTRGGFDRGDKATNTEWKCAVEGRTLYIAFKYTDSPQDWKQNFFFLPRLKKPYKDMAIRWFAHAGFLLKWKAVEDQIASALTDIKVSENIDNIVITGHSQGGAMSVFCHEYLKFHYVGKLLKTVTFGAPRAVWFWNFKKIKDRFEGIIQYRDKKDIVPHLPPKVFGYKDIGEIIEQGEKFKLFETIDDLITKWHTSYGGYFE